MASSKNLLLIALFWVFLISQTCKAQSAELEKKTDVQVEGERKNPKDTPAQIQSLIEDFAKAHDGGGRVAYKKVVQIGKSAIPYLKEALKDSRKNVRWISVEALGAIDGKEAVGPLVLALQDSDKDVRRYAAWFLGNCGQGNQEVSTALKNVLRDPSPEVVWHGMDALERLGETSYKEDMDIVDSLCLYFDNPDHRWREHTAKALGMVGNPRACAPLVNVLASEIQGSVVFALKEALVKIRSHDAVPLLLALLQDSTLDRRVYPSVAEVLRELGDPNINDSLLPLTDSSNKTIRSAAIDALGFAKNIQALPRLTEIVLDRSENSRVREYAARALGRIGNIEAVDALDKALVDENAMLRREAAKALGTIRCPQAVDSLIRALNDSNVFVVMYATKSLGKLGDKKAVKLIVELFDKGLPDLSLASNPRFANLPTVAHHALMAIMKEDVFPQKIETISNQDQLKEIREAWRIKLGLQEKSLLSSSQLPEGIFETQHNVRVKGDDKEFAKVLRWEDKEIGQTLFDIRDIVRFDWNQQIFELSRQKAMDLISYYSSDIRDYTVSDEQGIVYRGVLVSGPRYGIVFSKPTIAVGGVDLNLSSPLFKIMGNYPFDKDPDRVRFSQRMKTALADAGVLGKIDLNNPPTPITVISEWLVKKENLWMMAKIFPETFRLSEKARVVICVAKGASFEGDPDVVEINVVLKANSGKYTCVSQHDIPLEKLLADGSWAIEYMPWGPQLACIDTYAKPGPAEVSVNVLTRKILEGARQGYTKAIESFESKPIKITILPHEKFELLGPEESTD